LEDSTIRLPKSTRQASCRGVAAVDLLCLQPDAADKAAGLVLAVVHSFGMSEEVAVLLYQEQAAETNQPIRANFLPAATLSFPVSKLALFVLHHILAIRLQAQGLPVACSCQNNNTIPYFKILTSN
jgi:hypothetical protein